MSQGHLGSSTAGRSEGPSALRQQLKRETAGLHKRLEAQLGLIEPEFSIQRYLRVLEIFSGSTLRSKPAWCGSRLRAPRSAFRCVRAPS
jgi:hypothetical protein